MAAQHNNQADEALNPSSPFFLHPGDNPSSVVATPILEGNINYQIWRRNMSRALICKDKFGFVEGSIPNPGLEDPLHTAWMKCNTMVI
jgi:hypothetical protein